MKSENLYKIIQQSKICFQNGFKELKGKLLHIRLSSFRIHLVNSRLLTATKWTCLEHYLPLMTSEI